MTQDYYTLHYKALFSVAITLCQKYYKVCTGSPVQVDMFCSVLFCSLDKAIVSSAAFLCHASGEVRASVWSENEFLMSDKEAVQEKVFTVDSVDFGDTSSKEM